MKKLFAMIPLALCAASASAGDMTYVEAKPVYISGKVIMAETPDPLDESATPKLVRFPALELNDTFDLVCENPESGKPLIQHSSKQLQLAIPDPDQYQRIRAKAGKQVRVRCSLEAAMTAHHYTPVLCFVDDPEL